MAFIKNLIFLSRRCTQNLSILFSIFYCLPRFGFFQKNTNRPHCFCETELATIPGVKVEGDSLSPLVFLQLSKSTSFTEDSAILQRITKLVRVVISEQIFLPGCSYWILSPPSKAWSKVFMNDYPRSIMKCSYLKIHLMGWSLQDHIMFATLHQSIVLGFSTNFVKFPIRTIRFVTMMGFELLTFDFIIGGPEICFIFLIV